MQLHRDRISPGLQTLQGCCNPCLFTSEVYFRYANAKPFLINNERNPIFRHGLKIKGFYRRLLYDPIQTLTLKLERLLEEYHFADKRSWLYANIQLFCEVILAQRSNEANRRTHYAIYCKSVAPPRQSFHFQHMICECISNTLIEII